MNYPRYPEYKPSGVEWLGEVPGHWEVTALKRGFNVTLGKMLQPESSSPDDELLPYLRAANIQWGGVDTTDIKQMWLSKRDRAQLRLEGGDLLVSEGGDVGRSCLWAAELDNCYFQNSVNRVRARDGHSNRYLYYWMSTIKDKGYIDVLCNKSTIAHFTAEKVAAVPVPLPNPAEQTQIAAFLDRETAKIDELVTEQRRLMELLKEKRQAVISHAVTQGLNPHAPMKPSGIEWLGDVPAHWEVSRIKRICYINDGNHGEEYPSAEDYTDEQDGVPFIRAGNISVLSITSQDMLYITQEKNDSMRKGRLQTGDILFTNRGEIGKIAVIPPKYEGANLNSQIAYLRTDENFVVSKYFAHYLTSDVVFSVYDSVSAGSVLTQFPIGDLKNIPAILPPIAEQTAIATFLDNESAKFDTLTAEAQRAIDLLQERRSALISAAVTGQIDIRKTA